MIGLIRLAVCLAVCIGISRESGWITAAAAGLGCVAISQLAGALVVLNRRVKSIEENVDRSENGRRMKEIIRRQGGVR